MDMSRMQWLTVEGCPRSGTTIFGQMLNAHPEICLMHEFDQHLLFHTLDLFFSEGERVMAFGELEEGLILPKRSCHFQAVIGKLFEAISGKKARIVGSKFPGAHLWPQPMLPSGLPWLHIVLVRNPMATISSYMKKISIDFDSDMCIEQKYSIALFDWISAWNYALENINTPGYIVVRYEDITGGTQFEKSITSFLNIDDGQALDFSKFTSTNKTSNEYEEEFRSLISFEELRFLELICKYYTSSAHPLSIIGAPYRVGDEISFACESPDNVWLDRLCKGFYAAEVDGRWVEGHCAELPLTLMSPLHEHFLLHLNVIWVFEYEGESPIVSIVLNGIHVFQESISLGAKNGIEKNFVFPIRFRAMPEGSVLTLALECKNPRNPLKLGCSDDDRELSIMIKSLKLEQITAA